MSVMSLAREKAARRLCEKCGESLRECKTTKTAEEQSAGKILRELAPKLDYSHHKGQGGRIGVIGGSELYTGAPYYAAMTTMKAGGELAYIFSAKEACQPIKAYSPDLIVIPWYETNKINEMREEITNSFLKQSSVLHSCLIGPGLGTDERLLPIVKDIFEDQKMNNFPWILDADALRLFPFELLQTLSKSRVVVLTPNVRELVILFEKCGPLEQQDPSNSDLADHIAKSLNCFVVLKGKFDYITSGSSSLCCSALGSPKRVGGLGDVLAGTLSLLLAWSQVKGGKEDFLKVLHSGCVLVRVASRLTFEQHSRAMTAADVLQHVGPAFEYLTCKL